ncbi:glycosyltransferase family 4 protein [Pseudomonas sp. PDM04]|uniref:glycosyltransferase family 4 protein n=1 Tax=Pseudomonas sp. PDM04 TaxID=2769296 RepID=UPI0017830735|nr:glycosyltransferase family 4 protein [Pseudomonas sp. PDM04]MBD9438698.1 glycosyltransferase family 4 protein [Pseudomonas sp. PDM04]
MSKPLKILVVSQYFWPENMRINNLVEGFVAKGHEVTVLTGFPNYPEGKKFEEYKREPEQFSTYQGATVVRVPMLARGNSSVSLALNYLSFFLSASVVGPWKLRGKKFDSIFVYAVSPIMAAIPALMIGWIKKSPVFIWILDLWPETLSAVGIIKNPSLLSLVGRMVSFIYNRADYLLMQSKSFDENVRKYCTKSISGERLVYFPSWAEDDFSTGACEESDLIQADSSVFTVVFAGNIGEAQDFPAILRAAENVGEEVPVRWVIVGDGRASGWLHDEVSARGLSNVFLLGRHSLEKMPPLFAKADALLVSLKTNEVFEKTIPGKVQAYLASGRPIIAMIDGEAARVVGESGAGLACPSGDSQALADIVRVMAKLSPTQRDAMGAAGKAFYTENFSKVGLFDRLEELFHTASLRRNEKR